MIKTSHLYKAQPCYNSLHSNYKITIKTDSPYANAETKHQHSACTHAICGRTWALLLGVVCLLQCIRALLYTNKLRSKEISASGLTYISHVWTKKKYNMYSLCCSLVSVDVKNTTCCKVNNSIDLINETMLTYNMANRVVFMRL